VGSPALDKPLRTREQAAIDYMRGVLREIAQKSYEAETIRYLRDVVQPRIAELLGEAK